MNGRTLKVSLTLATTERVRGAVFLMDGRRLMNFDLGKIGPGSHAFSVPLEAGAVQASGVNLLVCKITSGNTETAKLVCMVK
jgi:hypothetical protein